MPDSPRLTDAHQERPDRSEKIEALLLAGLDDYFAGEHDRAISIWTRVLFLDRGHARARAYIERARSALAEHQRESDELIQRGATAFEEGRTAEARELLSAAVARGGPHDVALALLERLDRLGGFPLREAGRDAPRPWRPRPAKAGRSVHAGVWVLVIAAIVVLAVAALYVANASLDLVGLQGGRSMAVIRGAPPADALPLPRPAELALARARARAAAGHLKEALLELDRIGPGDSAHPDAQRLRADIQASLMAGLPPIGSADRSSPK